MKKQYRSIFLLLIVVLSLSLIGCKKNVGTAEDNPVKEEEAKEEKEKDETVEKTKIGISVVNLDNPFYSVIYQSISEEIEKSEDLLVVAKDPGGDAQKQEEQILEMIDGGIELLFLSPVNWEEITPSLEALKEAGVKVINVDSRVKETELTDAYIGSDNVTAGILIGEDMIKRFQEGGKIAIIETKGQNAITDRMKGLEETIAKAEKGFEVVGRSSGLDYDSLKSYAKELLVANPDIDAIICGNDQMALAVNEGAKEAGNTKVEIYGVDGSPDSKKELIKEDTRIVATVAQSPINMGKSAYKIARQMLEKEEYEKETLETVFLITKDNVDAYGADGWQ
ncbi:ABC-type sugar transport system substrate-binding protein [Aequitasia blattaphilus]|uniref:Substrate-binding domain-containing protein n=1 Tax=Aequitasia blattaphilus TaxID=2949332 RepID=A0ABT1E6P7_9FIRM|nr:substrate-binding domain-containing protein [Aequitasia blattaphilus]MCP1101510.1 substrate-binding domain-containing protein [Aequitasia blattaphilus]MCR8614150.1 substrate-binding domain-containing protein [Aequitasia blattaphilus]